MTKQVTQEFMPGLTEDETIKLMKYPRWVRLKILQGSAKIEDLTRKLERMERASAILDGMDYFTLNTGRAADDREDRPFYTISGNRIVQVATCGPDDIILIGRKEVKRE